MPDTTNTPKTSPVGLFAGALLLLVGCTAAFMARGFDDDSQTFPLVVAVLLAIAGAGIVGQSCFGRAHQIPATGGGRSVALSVAILIIWALAFSGGAGFVLPTVLMQAALMWNGGLRRPGVVAGIAVAVTAAAYLLFVALLDIPLPPSYLPESLQGF